MSAQAEATVKLSLIDRITNPIKKISARLSNLGKRIGFDRITRSVGNLGRSIQGLGTGLVRTTGRLTAFLGLLGAGGAGVIASAYGLAKTVSDLGSDIDDATHKLKISSDTLQEYRFVAKMSAAAATRPPTTSGAPERSSPSSAVRLSSRRFRSAAMS